MSQPAGSCVNSPVHLYLDRLSYKVAWLGHSGPVCMWAGVCCSWPRGQVTLRRWKPKGEGSIEDAGGLGVWMCV